MLGSVEGMALHKKTSPRREVWRAQPSTKESNPALVAPDTRAGAALRKTPNPVPVVPNGYAGAPEGVPYLTLNR